MALNRYDQISRHLARQAGVELWPWLLGLPAARVPFVGWLPTQLTVPGLPERVSDLIARLEEPGEGGRPWAVVLEFQAQPDFDMPDRLLVVLGLLRLTERPSANPGDRYWVGAAVVNLTGRGLTERAHAWQGAGLQVLVRPREWNFQDVDAGAVIGQVERGEAPAEALAWVPLMHGGGDPAIIQRWLAVARRQPDRRRRAELVLAAVLAELVGRQDAWLRALEGWEMVESPIIAKLLEQARQQERAAMMESPAIAKLLEQARQQERAQMMESPAIAKLLEQAEAKARAEMLLQVLQERFKAVPDDLRAAILAVADPARLSAGVGVALKARSLRKFREATGL